MGIPRLYQIFRTIRRDVGNTDFNLIRSFDRQPAVVNVVAFSPNGNRFATGNDNGEVYIYETETGSRLQVINADSTTVFALSFNPEKKQISAGGVDGWLRTFDVKTGKLLQEFIPVTMNQKSKSNF